MVLSQIFIWRCSEVSSPPMTQGGHKGRETRAISFKGTHFPQDSMLLGVRWYVAYP